MQRVRPKANQFEPVTKSRRAQRHIKAGASILATSLVPQRDHSLQAAAVASWRAAGFSVISVNGAKEAELVRAEFPEVTVVVATRTAEQFARKPVPYIHDLLKALRAACAARRPLADCTVGIINADIYLRPRARLGSRDPRARPRALCCWARGWMWPAARTFSTPSRPRAPKPIPSATTTSSCPGMSWPTSPTAHSAWECRSGTTGCPWWPCCTAVRSRSLTSPVALHVTHETRWDDTIYVFFHALVSYVIELCRTSSRPR